MLQQRRSKGKIVVNFIVCVALVSVSIFILLFKQHILDQIIIWQFHPTTEVSTLANRIGLSDDGKFVFLVSRPELDSSANFNKVCSRIETTTSILGCYSNFRIYIYNVTDTKLDGIREVTAAHEMLHAAYQRMSTAEKAKVDLLLEAEYKKLQTNKDFVNLMTFYARTEPGERDNELHSIIGTVVGSIDPALEAYYNQYFSNRQAVVVLYAKYNGVFQDLTDRAKVLADQLNALVISIPASSTQYNLDVQTLNSDITAFNKRVEDGDFISQGQSNTEQTALVARVDNIGATRTSINNDIDSYNAILVEYNSIASESKQLYNSMDSTLVPVPSV